MIPSFEDWFLLYLFQDRGGYGHPNMPAQGYQEQGPPPPGAMFQGSVIMVYGLNLDKISCDKLFNLFCLYGNVVRVCNACLCLWQSGQLFFTHHTNNLQTQGLQVKLLTFIIAVFRWLKRKLSQHEKLNTKMLLLLQFFQ